LGTASAHRRLRTTAPLPRPRHNGVNPFLLTILLCLVAAGLAAALLHARRSLMTTRRLVAEEQALRAKENDHAGRLERRNAELEATLGSMAEGVVVVDPEGRIRELNPAAADLLQLNPDQVAGQAFAQRVRNAALQRLLDSALGLLDRGDQAEELSAEVELRPGDAERHLRVEAAAVTDERGARRGAVLVLHDVTRLRRLESVRQDFVANVSHELRTPVSAVKAAVEALRSDPPPDTIQRARFTGIITRQADRLEAILADLLTLTQLDTAAKPAPLHPTDVHPSVAAAVESCTANARARNIALDVQVQDGLQACVVPARLEQALVNLIDNAVKYSPEGTRVTLTAQRTPSPCGREGAPIDEVQITVRDQGRGIEAHHLPRLFERFYRTDRARSRQLGGTGLGLSIVKHVAEQAGGRVSVESTLGRGSTFGLHLPTAEPPQA